MFGGFGWVGMGVGVGGEEVFVGRGGGMEWGFWGRLVDNMSVSRRGYIWMDRCRALLARPLYNTKGE